MSDPRYEEMRFDNRDHAGDLLSSVLRGELVCIVDEEAGGIIAYALGGGAAEIIVEALENAPDADTGPSGEPGSPDR